MIALRHLDGVLGMGLWRQAIAAIPAPQPFGQRRGNSSGQALKPGGAGAIVEA